MATTGENGKTFNEPWRCAGAGTKSRKKALSTHYQDAADSLTKNRGNSDYLYRAWAQTNAHRCLSIIRATVTMTGILGKAQM
jgi:hypothetical protein